MNKLFQLIAAVFLAILFSIDCNAQSNDSDKALLKEINGTAYRRTTFGIDARARVDSLWFLRVNGEFSSMLKFHRLASIQLLEMKSGWLGRIAKSYPNLYHLDFDASLLKADELDVLAELKNLDQLVITSDNSDGAACLNKIGQLLLNPRAILFHLARIFHRSVVDRRFSLSYWVWEQYFEFCDH